MGDFEKALAEAIEADGGELSEVKDQDGNILKKGDIVGFKAGMEQEGKIVKIRGKQITVKSLDREGFSGGYAAGQEYYDVMADDVWQEESVEPTGVPIEEVQNRYVRDMLGFIDNIMKRGEEATWKIWGLTKGSPPEEYELHVSVDPYGVTIEDPTPGYTPMRLANTANKGKIKAFFDKWIKTLSWDRMESVEPTGVPVEEAKGRTWSANGYLEIKTFDRLTSKDISAIKRYVMRWANGAENAGPSMLPKNKRWKATDARLLGGKLMIVFETDAPANRTTFQDIENEVIGRDGTGGMLWQFAVKDASSPDNLERRLYGGNWNADDHMYALRVVNFDIQPNVGFGEERRRPMARNPFGHAISEDAHDELAALVGEKGANAIVESMDARLPVEPIEENRPMDKGLRFEVINYEPGDFGGMGKAQGEYAVYIIGETFAIKDRLKKLGLRWDGTRKQWGLWNRYTSFGRSQRGSVSSKQVEKAIDKVKTFVKDYNAEVEKGNQAKLSGGGIADDPKPMTMRGQVKAIMSAQRLNKRLKKNGLVVTYDFPHSVGGFSEAGAYNAWVVGKTWLVKNALKRFGFTFNRTVPGDVARRAKEAGLKKVDAGWMMDGATYDRISKQVEQHLLRVAEGTMREAEEMDSNLDEAGFVIGAGGLEKPAGEGMKLQPNTAYYYGASSSPGLIIVDSVKGGRVTYYDPYSKKRRTEQEWIFRDLAEKGTRNWLKVYAKYQPELARNMKALLAGKSAKANGQDFDRFKVIVTVAQRKGDMWRAAEEFGSVGGFADDPDRYEIELMRSSLNRLRKDRRFSIESETKL